MTSPTTLPWWQRRRARFWGTAVLLFGLALALRLLALGRYVTPDELIWVYRSALFREALLHGRFAETLVAGHPGVTTTWLGALAISLQLWLQPASSETYALISKMAALTPDNMVAYQWLYTFLDGGRILVALLNSLGLVAVFALAAQLFGRRVAFVGALLLALDPFVAGLSSLLHVDGLLTTFSILSLLALALGAGWGRAPLPEAGRLGWTAASGAFAALAALSKTPALLLLPIAALTLASGLLRKREAPFARRLGTLLLDGLVWLGSFLAVFLALFPALWSDPAAVLATVSGNTGRHVEEALRPTFFMGDVSFNHGPAFYPVVILWRSTPLLLVGVGLLLPQLRQKSKLVNWRVLLLLGGWVLLFLLMTSVAAKKFDRYALPVFPALALLAGAGLAMAQLRRRTAVTALLAAAAALQVIMLIFSLPYLLSAYNLLLGGPYTAQYVLPVGWGESVSASGHWLAAQPGAAGASAATGLPPALAPFFPGETLSADAEGPLAGDNIIVTVTGRQEEPEETAALLSGLALRQTLRYGLLDGARVYANPQPRRAVPQPQAAPGAPAFGEQVRLLAQEIHALEGGDVRYTAVWERLDAAARPRLSLTLRDAQGEVWNDLQTPLLNETAFYMPDWANGETPQVSYLLKLPPVAPPGSYVVEVSLLDEIDGSLLPVRQTDGAFGGVTYEAGEVEVSVPLLAINPGALGLEMIIDQLWAEGSLRLLGSEEIPVRALAGGTLPLSLYWQALQPLPEGLQLGLRLGDGRETLLPLSRYDSGRWEAGRTLQERYRLPIAPEQAGGDYPLEARLLDAAGQPYGGDMYVLGEVRVDTLDRLYDLPPDIAQPLEVNFAQGISLRGVDPGAAQGEAGGVLPLTLYWQSAGQTAVPLTAFVHLLDEQGQIRAQADRWPGGLPSDVWSAGQVIVDEYALALPPDLPPGTYQIGVGLYDAQSGVRLPAQDAGGRPVADGRVLLPLTVTIGGGS